MRGATLVGVAGLIVVVAGGCAPSREPVAAATTAAPRPTVPSPTTTPTPTPRATQRPASGTPTYRSLEEVYLLHNELYSYGARFAIYRWAAYVGDEDSPAGRPDHGSRKSNTAWAKAAFKAKSPAACNTWVVPAKRVS